MGLDLALGGLVLVMAVRGWFKGFLLQAVRLAGVVICVYAADPVRDQLKPRVVGHLPTIRPELIDRMLWWSSAVASYVVLVGVTTLAIKLYRRQPYGLEERHRGDQFAGALLGSAKAVLVAAFLVAGLEKYALVHLDSIPRAREQVKTSRVMVWNDRYRPVAKIWASPPVQHFVRHVQERGLNSPVGTTEKPEPTSDPVQTASRTPKLQWAAPAPPALEPAGVDPEITDALRQIEEELSRVRRSK